MNVRKDIGNMEKSVEICPITSITKDDKIASFKKEPEKWEKEGIYPFSEYAKEKYPQVCIGNCEECKNWKSVTEKELWLMNNDTFANHAKYGLTMFTRDFILSLPITLIVSPFMFGNVISAPLMSLIIAGTFRSLYFLVGFGQPTFNKWLENKWENRKEQ